MFLQETERSIQANDDRLHTADDDDEAGVIENRECSEPCRAPAENQGEGQPRRDVQHDHADGLSHHPAELAARSDSLAERADVRGHQRRDRGPVCERHVRQSGVRNAGEDDHITDAIGELVEDLPAPARLPRRQRHHAVEHVHPQPSVTKQRRDQ